MAKKVLLVDDDLYIRELYQEVLRDMGYEVTTATNGEEGLVQMQNGGFNLILLDVMMPKLDGLGVLTMIAQKPPKVANGPIILLTNLSSDPIIQDALTKGAKGYIIKSDLTPEEFSTKINAVLGA